MLDEQMINGIVEDITNLNIVDRDLVRQIVVTMVSEIGLHSLHKLVKKNVSPIEELEHFDVESTRELSNERSFNVPFIATVGESMYLFNTHASVDFQIKSDHKVSSVTAFYTDDDTVLNKNSGREEIQLNHKKLTRTTGKNGKYTYSFGQDFVYKSKNEITTKPVILVIETKQHGLAIGAIVFVQRHLGRSFNDGRFEMYYEDGSRFFANRVGRYKENEFNQMNVDFPNNSQVDLFYSATETLISCIKMGTF